MPKDTHIIEVKATGAKKSEKEIKGVSGALGGLAKQAGVAAAAYFGSQALLQGIRSSIDLFAQQEVAEKKLRFAAGASTEELIRQAKSLQQVTSFGDEAIIAQQAYVKSLGVSTEQTKEIVAASVDLAAAMGISLESAVMNTTKTLSGMQGELGEKLPAAFKLLTAEQLKAGEGIKFIREQFKGTAEVEAKSMTGQLQQMKNAVGDAGEALGETLAPIVVTIAGKLKSAAEAFQSFIFNTTASDTEIAIKNLKEMGIDTTTLELNMVRLEKNKAMSALGESVITVGTNMDTVVSKQNELNSANEKHLESMNQRVALEQEILEATGGQKDLEEILLDAQLQKGEVLSFAQIQRLEELKAAREAFETEQLEHEARIENIQKEIEERQKLEELRLNEVALEEQLGVNNKKNTEDEIKDEGKKSKIKDKLSKLDLKNKGTIKEKIKELDVFEKAKDIKEGIRTAYGIGADAFRYGTKLGGPVLGAVLGAVGLAGGLAYQKKIMAAQYGADFVTSGPQLMMVGEGSGPERVQVTPLVDENINGPQGGNINLTINSPIMSEEYTEEVIIPQIKEGLRLGGDIGI
tara:strand:- start:1324 stop:3057 length:1734 start_codon:yes stop_codon:yes gene_type:complete